jgi:broad specificity phosphatase PhoE
MPNVQPDVPAREWHLGDDGRGAARNLGQMLPARARLVASDEPKAVETLAEASGRSDVVIDSGFGEVRRPNAPSGQIHRALARGLSRRRGARRMGAAFLGAKLPKKSLTSRSVKAIFGIWR